ncbi:hypothetical protein ANN_08385 [Periplaneta americana]|uniref:Ribosomal protein mS38 C-terminal domain-containing protein n=1 Tax=Periplaneta americana TaxID=6978 RepID=A0ABQ8T1A3_PERAM|nr:hypothetical protein ANN_08385 [Periplaneta americana]
MYGLTCFGLCSNYKYMHSVSTSRRCDKLAAYSMDHGLQQAINSTVFKTAPVNFLLSGKLNSITLRQQDDVAKLCGKLNSITLRQQDDVVKLSSQFYRPQNKIELPVVSNSDILKAPPVNPNQESNYEPTHYIEAPTLNYVIEKQAARLIVIRRRKMKKHKLRKLRIRMKYEWAKVRQRREMRKEKAFQAKLIAQIKEAEKFDAKKYVEERLQKAHEMPLPRTWKGKRLPFFIIKQKLGIK